MPTPRESDLQNRNAVVTESDISSSLPPATAATFAPKPIPTENREFPHVYNAADRQRRSSPNRENNNKNKSDDAGPQSPSSAQTPRPHSQILHTPSGQESSASDDTGAQPLDPSSTFQERLSALEAVWQSAESSVSRLGAALEKREDGKTVEEERRSPDRFFVIDEATRVEDHERESDERARVEGRAGKRKRSSEAEDAPTMRREGTKEGDRERRVRELEDGVLEEEGKL